MFNINKAIFDNNIIRLGDSGLMLIKKLHLYPTIVSHHRKTVPSQHDEYRKTESQASSDCHLASLHVKIISMN